MKNSEQEIGRAIRIEHIESEDKLFLVFEITHPKFKQELKTDWVKDIEFKIINKKLILEDQ